MLAKFFWRPRNALIACLIILGFSIYTTSHWVGADPGDGENAYLLAAQLLVDDFSVSYAPPDQFSFIDFAWVDASDGRFYLKFPIGTTLLHATARWVAKICVPTKASLGPYVVSPICMIFFLIGSYLVFRIFFEFSYSVIGLTLLAINPVTVYQANLAYSHGPSMCVSVWGMYALLRWWKRGGALKALTAGLLLGLLVSIRYDDGLFLIPILVIVCLRWRHPEGCVNKECGVVLAGWLLPVFLLLIYNWISIGSLTGYDYTNESTGFSLKFLPSRLHHTLRAFNSSGLPWVFPFSVLGAGVLLMSNRPLAAIVLAWILPNFVLHLCYYYLPEGQLLSASAAMNQLRFFAPNLPALVLLALWCWSHLRVPALTRHQDVVIWVFVALAAVTTLSITIPLLNKQQSRRLRLQTAGREIVSRVDPGSMVVGIYPIIAHLQVIGDYRLYDVSTFHKDQAKYIGRSHEDRPYPLSVGRRRRLYEFLTRNSQDDIIRVENQIMRKAMRQGRRVFFILRHSQTKHVARLVFPPDRFSSTIVHLWRRDEQTGKRRCDIDLVEVLMGSEPE